jgi:hypothetical protein
VATSCTYIPKAIIERKVTPGKRPGWIANPPVGYFVGVSRDFVMEGEARRDALLDARKQIVDSLGVRLTKEEVEELVVKGEASEVLSPDVLWKVKTQVISKSIVRARDKEWYTEKWEIQEEGKVRYFWKAFVLIRFSQAEHDQFIEELVHETHKLAKPILKEADSLLLRGDIADAITKMKRVLGIVDEVLGMPGIKPALISDVKKLRIACLGRLERISSKVVGLCLNSDQSCEIGEGLTKPLLFKVVYNEASPLQGILVKFRFVDGSGELDQQAVTDKDGVAQCRVYKVLGRDTAIIEAETLPFIPNAKPLKGRFTIHLSTLFLVKISERNLSTRVSKSKVETAIIEGLIKAGFRVVSPDRAGRSITDSQIDSIIDGNVRLAEDVGNQVGANILVIGQADTWHSSTLMEGFVFCRARCVVQVIKTNTGNVILQKDIQSKGAGSNEVNAGSKALENLAYTVSQTLIEELQERLDLPKK